MTTEFVENSLDNSKADNEPRVFIARRTLLKKTVSKIQVTKAHIWTRNLQN